MEIINLNLVQTRMEVTHSMSSFRDVREFLSFWLLAFSLFEGFFVASTMISVCMLLVMGRILPFTWIDLCFFIGFGSVMMLGCSHFFAMFVTYADEKRGYDV